MDNTKQLAWFYLAASIITTLALFFFFLCTQVKAEEISEEVGIKCIMGEGRNQGYDGLLALSFALKNRGTINGVYGCKAVFKEPQWVWDLAKKAWRDTQFKPDVTLGADHWENIKAFGTPRWASSMKQTIIIKDHVFYKSK